MPHPIANIAMSLAPFAADLVGKVLDIKKEGKNKKNLEIRVDKLENYEVEQAKLLEDLTLQVDYLKKKNGSLQMITYVSLIISMLAFGVMTFMVLYWLS